MGMRRCILTVAVVWLAAGTAQGAVGGTYSSPMGTLEVKVTAGAVMAVSRGGGPCRYKKGQTVLRGAMLEDSVTGRMTVCSRGPGCGVEEAFVVLVVARKGDLLSGAVQLKNKTCKLPTKGRGIKLSRRHSGKGTRVASRHNKRPRARAGRSEGNGAAPSADPRGTTASAAPEHTAAAQQTVGTSTSSSGQQVAAADPPAEGAAVPFAAWDPDAAPTAPSGVRGRKAALGKAKEAARLLDAGRFEAARPLLLEALGADPAYAEGYNMMGVTYYARDRYDDALDWYKKALTVNPDFGDAYYNIACIYSIEGKKPLALKYLRVALLNGYAEREAMEKDADLDPIRGEGEYQDLMKILAGGPAAVEVLKRQAQADVQPAAEAADAGAGDAGSADGGSAPSADGGAASTAASSAP